MAIAKVADRAGDNGFDAFFQGFLDISLSGITIGNYIIIRSAFDNSGGGGAARTVTLSNVNPGTMIGTYATYQQNCDPGAANAGTTINVSIFKAEATSGYIRISVSGSGACAWAIQTEEWSGIHSTTPVVGTPVGATATNSTNIASCTDASVAADNVAYAAISVEGPFSDTFTQDTDTTNGTWVSLTSLTSFESTATSNQAIYGAYKLVTATGAQTYNPTISPARDSAGLILELAAAGIDISITSPQLTASAQANAPTIAFPPSAPTNLSGTPGNNQVALTWTAPSSGGTVVDYETRYAVNAAELVIATTASASVGGTTQRGQSFIATSVIEKVSIRMHGSGDRDLN
jgi:hypothetical protein